MSRSSVPWQVRATERAWKCSELGAQAMRIEQTVEELRARAERRLVEAERDLMSAGRLEVLEHQALTRLDHEQRMLVGLLERAGIDVGGQIAVTA